jgi:hypothetical protein
MDDLADEASSARAAAPVLPSRSEALDKARREAAEEEAQEVAKAKKKKKKRKKQSGFFDPQETLKLVAGVGVVVAVIAVIAWRSPEFRFPLGGLLCLTGFIVYLLGAISIRQLVAEEGMFNLLLYRFFPPYQWWFVISRWSDTRDYFAFFASGLLILALGGSILKLSPQGRLADKAEREYQRAQLGGQADEDDDTPAAPAPKAAARTAPPAQAAAPPAQAEAPPAQQATNGPARPGLRGPRRGED